MSVEFIAHGGRVIAEVDALAAAALDGVLAEVRGVGDSPDLRRFSADLAGAYERPVELDSDGVLVWLRALVAVRSHLAVTLAVVDLPRSEVDAQVSQLAVDSPVATAARAFLWVGVLLEELCRTAQ